MIALQATGIGKRFGGAVALQDASFVLRRGEVHVLIGSNGCGKSTLCKIIAGSVAADAGSISYLGKTVSFATPAAARAAGIATVYQETSLIPTLSVMENIVLGAEPLARGYAIDRAAMRVRATELLHGPARALAGHLDLDANVGALSIDQQQIVEIVKVLGQDPQIVLFDEATSSLDRAQVEAFFAVVRELRARDRSVIFISHRMDELFAIGDSVTVMRNGRTVAQLAIGETTKEAVVHLMVGGAPAASVARQHDVRADTVALRAEMISGQRFIDASFTLRAGEILGLGGLHGQGQSDLLLGLFGAPPIVSGTVTLADGPRRVRSPMQAMQAGLAYVSGDRGRAGSLAIRPIFENLTISLLWRRGLRLVRPAALRTTLGPVIERLRIKFPGFAAPMTALSGGNQQKVIVARWLATRPRVLLLDDPTKGIDIQAKRDLYEIIGELCRDGAAILFYSSDDTELLEAADRVLVFNGGRVVAELEGERMTEYHLNAAALAMA